MSANRRQLHTCGPHSLYISSLTPPPPISLPPSCPPKIANVKFICPLLYNSTTCYLFKWSYLILFSLFITLSDQNTNNKHNGNYSAMQATNATHLMTSTPCHKNGQYNIQSYSDVRIWQANRKKVPYIYIYFTNYQEPHKTIKLRSVCIQWYKWQRLAVVIYWNRHFNQHQ